MAQHKFFLVFGVTDRPFASRLLLESSLVDKKRQVLELESRKVISEAPREDLAQALSSLCCGWKTPGYKTGISIILEDKKRILELWKGKPDVQAREALEDPGLELEPRQVILKAPVKILRKPCRVFAVAGRLRATRPASASSWTRRGSWNCERANLMCRRGRRWRTRAWSSIWVQFQMYFFVFNIICVNQM